MKITDYWVATAESQRTLIAKVKEAIAAGYQALGGVAIRVYSMSQPSTWAQAMVKYEN